MPRPKIAEADFVNLTKALAEEIQSAHIDYQLYEDLSAAADENEIVVIQSRAFWTMTIQNHLNSAILRLCRVYDQQKSSMNLSKWLKIIKNNQKWFVKQPVDTIALDKDIEYASNDNPLVKNLTKYRGNVIAHIGENYVLDVRSTRKSFKLTHGNVKELLAKGLSIVNHYSSQYNQKSWSPNLVGADDYQFVFRELKNAIERIKAKQ